MHTVSPGPGRASQHQRARASSSADGASSNIPVSDPGTAARATDARPAVGDPEAALRDSIVTETSQAADRSCDRHQSHLPQQPAPVRLSATCFSVDELKARALSMFIVLIGSAPRVSGCGLVMEKVTAELVINVTKAVEALMGTPQKPGSHRKEMIRCCGELDKEEARGWLVADAVGRPLLHRNDDRTQNDPREVGKRVLQRAGKAEQAIASVRQTALAAVRAATRAAAKDASLQQLVADAEANVATSTATARAAPVELDFPNVTVADYERPESYWRRREVGEADATAAAAAAEAVMAAAVKQGADARLKRAMQASDGPDPPASAVENWLEVSAAWRAATTASREAAKEARETAAKAAATRAAAEAAGVDFRSAKRKREDEAASAAAAEAAARTEVSNVVMDLVTTVAAHERAEPFWISLPHWYDIECEVRQTQALWTERNLRYPEELAAETRARVLAEVAVRAEMMERKTRELVWVMEQKADPAVLALARRLEAGKQPYSRPLSPTDEECEAAGEEGFDALWDAWSARDDAMWAAVEPLMPASNFYEEQHHLARLPWEKALTVRMREDEGRDTGDWRRGRDRSRPPWAPYGGMWRCKAMKHPWPQ